MLIPSLASEMTTACQLFWDVGDQGFPEAQSMTCTLKLNNSRQCVQFPFPELPQPLTGLRLDFADSPAGVVVLSMALRDEDQAEQWRWDGSPDMFANLAEGHVTPGESDGPVVLLSSHGLDPRCVLAIPADVLAQVRGGWHLELILSPQADPLHDLLRTTLQHDHRLAAISKLVVDQRHHIEALERTCREQSERMAQMAEQGKVQQLVIARYEENDAIIRRKLTDHDNALKAITGNKWLRRLFSFKEAPSL